MSFIETMLAHQMDAQADRILAAVSNARTRVEKAAALEALEVLLVDVSKRRDERPMTLSKLQQALAAGEAQGARRVLAKRAGTADVPAPPAATELDAMPFALRGAVLQTNAALEAAQAVGGKTLEAAVRDAQPVLARLEAWRGGQAFEAARKQGAPIRSFRDLIAPPAAA